MCEKCDAAWNASGSFLIETDDFILNEIAIAKSAISNARENGIHHMTREYRALDNRSESDKDILKGYKLGLRTAVEILRRKHHSRFREHLNECATPERIGQNRAHLTSPNSDALTSRSPLIIFPL